MSHFYVTAINLCFSRRKKNHNQRKCYEVQKGNKFTSESIFYRATFVVISVVCCRLCARCECVHISPAVVFLLMLSQRAKDGKTLNTQNMWNVTWNYMRYVTGKVMIKAWTILYFFFVFFLIIHIFLLSLAVCECLSSSLTLILSRVKNHIALKKE